MPFSSSSSFLVQGRLNQRCQQLLVEDHNSVRLEVAEFDLIVEATKACAVQVRETICCKDLDSSEIFHAIQKFVGKAQFPRVLGLLGLKIKESASSTTKTPLDSPSRKQSGCLPLSPPRKDQGDHFLF